MKKSTNELIAIAAGIAAGSAMGILFAPEARKKFAELRKNPRSRKYSRERLEMVKGKLEMVMGKLDKHKTRLDMHLQRINSKLAEFETTNS